MASILLYILLFLSGHTGQVTFAGVPVPGATVTAVQGNQKFVAITDQMGIYAFPDLPDGMWAIQVEMLGFSTVKGDASTTSWELKMLPIDEIHAQVVHAAAPEPAPAPPSAAAPSNAKQPAAPPRQQAGFQRTEVNASTNASAAPPANETPAPSGAFSNLSA